MSEKPTLTAAAVFVAGLALVLPAAGCAAGTPAENAAVQPQSPPAVKEQSPQPAVPAAAAVPEVQPKARSETPVSPPQPDPAGETARPAVVAPPAASPAKTAPAAAAPVKPGSPSASNETARKPPAAASARSEAQPLPPLALATLEQRLKDTSAIGVFTKLALKNQVDDILAQVRAHHEGRGPSTLNQLRQSYDQLLLKVHDLLKNGDPPLATAIMNSREAIWAVLTDPVKFAKL